MSTSTLWVQVLEWTIDVLAIAASAALIRKRRSGWAFNFVSECLWFVVSVVTGQYAFTVMSLVFGVMNLVGFLRWRPPARELVPLVAAVDALTQQWHRRSATGRGELLRDVYGAADVVMCDESMEVA